MNATNTNLHPFSIREWLRNEATRMLSISMAFSVCMIVARVVYSGQTMYLFLVWNLFLAFIPYALTHWLQYRTQQQLAGWQLVVVFGAWILFIPNSFYIITDLFHLGNYYNIPLWFDLALILSFAWNGLLLGLLSVRQMEKIIQQRWHMKNELYFIYPVMWLNALGVYVGRYLRFNSWDVFTNPLGVVADIVDILLHPVQYRYAWGMILCFSVLMTLMYLGIKRIGKVIH
jgi:uncharacterized membrane protein